ncbi:Zn(II)2Cys6 transcription factor [Aspergillus tanneri]|uniref:Zn(2)-C6 fungal-type domain-containing protein n=1 Tax=Aspergillus tanneri TaxID=1220188 RepID=A0A5M9MLY1_9EURO|nr:uncharacterized protein ATNIH1004_003895 [Aspergillus tanneri]KAA8648012.1 hypothetical protein ATNIH1004_003895 [Aspergillus tanneri]
MPSKQRINRKNRRRTGCHQCKDKHVRCTEEKPRCQRCDKLGLKCDRGLKLMYQEDALRRGISFGRQGIWSKTQRADPISLSFDVGSGFFAIPLDQYIGRWIFLNTTPTDFAGDRSFSEEDDCVDVHRRELLTNAMVCPGTQLTITSLGHPLAAYSKTEAYLLDYFIQGIGPHCALSPNDNPYISLVMPLCFEYPSLQNSLLAVSGNQLRLIGDTRFTKETLVYKSRAINGLHKAISQGIINDGVFATVLMLCFHDISDGCDSSWIIHLHAGLELIKYTSDNGYESSSLLKFFRMYFVAHDIMNRTVSQGKIPGRKCLDWAENDDLDE